jgi:hypothetical protein
VAAESQLAAQAEVEARSAAEQTLERTVEQLRDELALARADHGAAADEAVRAQRRLRGGFAAEPAAVAMQEQLEAARGQLTTLREAKEAAEAKLLLQEKPVPEAVVAERALRFELREMGFGMKEKDDEIAAREAELARLKAQLGSREDQAAEMEAEAEGRARETHELQQLRALQVIVPARHPDHHVDCDSSAWPCCGAAGGAG